MSETASAIDDLLALEARRCDALAAADGTALAALYSEDYVHCHATGVVHDKTQMIKHMLAMPRRVAPRTPLARVYSEVGVLTGEMININPTTGDRVALFVTQVARRDAQGWRFVSFQATRLAPAAS